MQSVTEQEGVAPAASPVACPLCGEGATLAYRGHPGYQLPTRFDIYHCGSCDTKFVEPLESSAAVYDLIYRHIEDVRGYARYARFARTVARRKDPLAYLADEEDCYWGIEQYLSRYSKPKAPRLLEVGSGLGYLTYAISRRGYDIRGIDVSAVAVADARARFGDLYDCGDVFSVATVPENVYDAVVMTELVEHIPNLVEFVTAGLRLVKPGGDLVLTTPNKTNSPSHVLWDTDSPPVHLWWLSERSIETLASRLGVSLRLIDFTDFNRTHAFEVHSGPHMAKPTVPPVFDQRGRLIARPRPLTGALRRAAFAVGLDKLYRATKRRRAAAQIPSARRPTMCAILTKRT